MDHDRRKKLDLQLGRDISEALDKAEVQGEERIFMMLECAYALAAQSGWSLQQLLERAGNKWTRALQRDTAGQLIKVVTTTGERIH